jgi:ferrochelatase
VVVPISFVSEHIETLEEIDIEYRELAEDSGITNWRRCPALNTDKTFIDDMADLVVDALQEPVQTVTEACVTNNVGDVELQPLDERVGITSVGVGGVGAETEMLKEPERLLARVAIAGVLLTFLVEIVSGSSVVNLFSSGV